MESETSTGKPLKPRRLKGFRDYLPHVMEAREELLRRTLQNARLAGFRPIATPTLEYAETLVGQGSEETDKQVYLFRDQGDRLVGLRFDLTLPLARFIAEHQGMLTFPLKTLHVGQVFRGENPQKGRYREFAQCDLDILGVDSLAADVEILVTLGKIYASLELGPTRTAIGHRGVLSSLLRRVAKDLTPAEETKALIALDKLDKIGKEKVCGLLAEVGGMTVPGAGELVDVLTCRQGAETTTDMVRVRDFLQGLDGEVRVMFNTDAALARLEDVARLVGETAAAESRFQIDLSIARGLGYYTGVVFETTLDRYQDVGSISSGGRYNNLVERFSSRSLPGVGGSVGIDRIIGALEETPDQLPAPRRPVFVAVIGEETYGYGFRVASALRDAGIATDIGVVAKVKKQFQHADRLGCPVVITVGDDEAKDQVCTLKVMATGSETRAVPLAGLVERVRSSINA